MAALFTTARFRAGRWCWATHGRIAAYRSPMRDASSTHIPPISWGLRARRSFPKWEVYPPERLAPFANAVELPELQFMDSDTPMSVSRPAWQWKDDLSIVRGKHTIKFWIRHQPHSICGRPRPEPAKRHLHLRARYTCFNPNDPATLGRTRGNRTTATQFTATVPPIFTREGHDGLWGSDAHGRVETAEEFDF